jgi:hypothetical protein
MSSIIIEWSVLQWSSPSYPQNRRSLSKSVLAGFHGLGTHEESMETQFDSLKLWLESLRTISDWVWLMPLCAISHEFWIHGIQLLLISGVSFYFAKKEKIIEVQTIQSLYWPFHLFYWPNIFYCLRQPWSYHSI